MLIKEMMLMLSMRMTKILFLRVMISRTMAFTDVNYGDVVDLNDIVDNLW